MAIIPIAVDYKNQRKIVHYKVSSYAQLIKLVREEDPLASGVVTKDGRLINTEKLLRVFAGTTLEPFHGPFRTKEGLMIYVPE